MTEFVLQQSPEATGDCALVQMRQPGDLDKGYLHRMPAAASRLILADSVIYSTPTLNGQETPTNV